MTRLHAHLADALKGMSVGEVGEGRKGHEACRLPRVLNPLGLASDALRTAELLE